jgi:hypothetical protein
VELAFSALLFLLPLTYIWVPAHYHTYGRGEAVCWMKTEDQDCQYLNRTRIDSITMETVEVVLHVAVIIAFLSLVTTLTFKIAKLKKSNVKGTCRVTFLMAVTCISTLIRISQLLVNLSILIFQAQVNHFLYDVIDDPAYTFSNLLVPIGFGVYLYSMNKLRFKLLKKAAKKWLCCRMHSHSGTRTERTKVLRKSGHDVGDDEGLQSVESSIERDVPSHTTYSSPYTNEFTDVTEIISSKEYRNIPKYGTIKLT